MSVSAAVAADGSDVQQEESAAVDYGLVSPEVAAAAPCGLSGTHQSATGGTLFVYKIRNCHDYTVKRKVDVSRGGDGYCHTIGAGATVSGSVHIPFFASQNGLKAC